MLKENLKQAEAKEHKEIEGKIQTIIDERTRLRNMVRRMSYNLDQDALIRANKLRHADLINEQLRHEHKLKELGSLDHARSSSPTYFPFTHGDQIDEQRKRHQDELKQELAAKHREGADKRYLAKIEK